MRKVKQILCNQQGQTMSEYGLLIALIAVAALAAITLLGGALAEKFKEVGEEVKDAKPIE